MLTSIITALTLMIQGASIYLIYWITRQHKVNLTNAVENHINCNADYLTARALILQHLIEDWDKERWQAELDRLDEIVGKNYDERA